MQERRNRLLFRRKKERLFLRSMIAAQVLIAIIFLLGVGFSIKDLHDTRDDVRELVNQQQKGHRFTAGNAWQMSQLIFFKEVDMTNFPDHDLIYPDGTWFNGWLEENNYIVKDK